MKVVNQSHGQSINVALSIKTSVLFLFCAPQLVTLWTTAPTPSCHTPPCLPSCSPAALESWPEPTCQVKTCLDVKTTITLQRECHCLRGVPLCPAPETITHVIVSMLININNSIPCRARGYYKKTFKRILVCVYTNTDMFSLCHLSLKGS